MREVRLQADPQASLRWEVDVEEGPILWHLDMGLFDRLPAPLADEAQLLALQLAVEHFNKTIWHRYQQATAGVILYRGKVPFADPLAAEYIRCLVAEFADGVEVIVHLDARAIETYSEFFKETSQECFDHVRLEIESPFAEKFAYAMRPSTALCLPGNEKGWEQLDEIIGKISVPFRVIPERNFIYEWDGLDTVIVSPEGVTMQGRRKLNGFKAAGGTVLETF